MPWAAFSFAELLPDLYSIQVSFASFVPAVKERIQIKAGMRSLLDVSLSRVFSSIQLVSTTPVPGGLMNDSWKWILRADSPTRPVLRILPAQCLAAAAAGLRRNAGQRVDVQRFARTGENLRQRWSAGDGRQPGGPRDSVCFCHLGLRRKPPAGGGRCGLWHRPGGSLGRVPDHLQPRACRWR